jgi:hypothetical protein
MVKNHLEVENKLHDMIRTLKIQLQELRDDNSRLRKERGLPDKTKWVEKDG